MGCGLFFSSPRPVWPRANFSLSNASTQQNHACRRKQTSRPIPSAHARQPPHLSGSTSPRSGLADRRVGRSGGAALRGWTRSYGAGCECCFRSRGDAHSLFGLNPNLQHICLPPIRSLATPCAQERDSYALYEWLRERCFDVIVMSFGDGIGFHSLAAKTQGIAFPNTLFCLVAQTPSQNGSAIHRNFRRACSVPD